MGLRKKKIVISRYFIRNPFESIFTEARLDRVRIRIDRAIVVRKWLVRKSTATHDFSTICIRGLIIIIIMTYTYTGYTIHRALCVV